MITYFEFSIVKNAYERLIVRKMSDDSIWIERGDGEGGDFSSSELYDVLDKFYKDKF